VSAVTVTDTVTPASRASAVHATTADKSLLFFSAKASMFVSSNSLLDLDFVKMAAGCRVYWLDHGRINLHSDE